jgi:hypothetical protein
VLALGAFDDDNVERIVRNTYASNAHALLPSFPQEQISALNLPE